MKNQYFGDVNDYCKYGLLRVLQAGGSGRLLVAWMLTPDDGGRDGRFLGYLDAPAKWAIFDRVLFDGLSSLVRSKVKRAVRQIERTQLLPRTHYYSQLVPDVREDRMYWRKHLLLAASGVDLVFVDPDNGIEVPSKPVGQKRSSKYVTWDEIESLWAKECSVLIYQHYRREPRDTFVERMVADLRSHTGANLVEAFRTPRTVFLLAVQNRHARPFRNAVSVLSDRWGDQIKPMGWLYGGSRPK